MWLYIFDGGEVKKSELEPCQDDKDAADDGILDLIDITDGKPLQYYEGKWNELLDASESS